MRSYLPSTAAASSRRQRSCLAVLSLILAPAAGLDAKAAEESAPDLETITVIGTRERPYRSFVAPTTNKSDTLLKETPFSIQTVTSELIEDRGVTTLGGAISTVPGVTSQVGWGGSNDRFRLRGFATTANLKNGFRRSVFAPVDELVNIQQIEVLKGPASALYGRFEPGGVVNIVTKKPLDKPQTDIELTAGRYDFYRSTVDSTGPLGDQLGYRLTGSWQSNHSFRDFVDNDTQFISPVFQWTPSSRTTVTAEFELGKKRAAFDRGFGNSPLFLEVPIRYNYGEADANLKNNSALASLVLDHKLENGWDLHAGLQGSRARTDALWYAYGFPPVSGEDTPDPIVNRRKQRSIDEQKDMSALAEASRRFTTGAIGHRVLVGADYNYEDWDFTADAFMSGFGFPANLPISLRNPVHGVQTGAMQHYDSSRYTTHNVGLYAQDEMTLGEQWRLLLGLRYDRARTSGRAEYLLADGALKRTDDAYSPRIGLTWTPAEPVSFYGSWAKSFLTETNGGMLRSGGLPQPSRGEQFEVGAKLSLLAGRLEPTLALFDIRRTNGVVGDPEDFNYVIQVGEQRSRGWELDIPYTITPQWRLLASYTQLTAQVTEDSDATIEGNRVANAPKRSASLWTTYDFTGWARGLRLGLGATYVGAREANTANTFELPAFTRWDANAIYRFGPADRYKLQLTVQNLTDKRYYESGGSFVPTFAGAPRTVMVTFGIRL
ncbi:TonB-dependent siderophore receptor [Pseudomonadota bacterium AL_CKDN230030165-1A_HGKHYDSX7]